GALAVLKRVGPARISGPTGSVISRSNSVAGVGDPGLVIELSVGPRSIPAPTAAGLQVSKIVFAPNDFALASAPSTKGVRPLAVIPITTSAALMPRSSNANAP